MTYKVKTYGCMVAVTSIHSYQLMREDISTQTSYFEGIHYTYNLF